MPGCCAPDCLAPGPESLLYLFMLDALMRMAEGDDGGSITSWCWTVGLYHLPLRLGAAGQPAAV